MLIIISDLHLTDGTGGSTISAGAFHLLAERMADLAMGASRRLDGEYRPIDHIDLVLLGDVLDLIRSTRWLDSEARPWGNPASTGFLDAVATITAATLDRNEASLRVLRSLAGGAIHIPVSTQDGLTRRAAETAPVPVRIHYVVGNHDWFLHLPGDGFNTIREQVALQMGLVNSPHAPFPHEPAESDELLAALRRHKVFARHGDKFDPFNFEGDRDASSLGDAIVVELLSRFGRQVELDLADDLPAATLAGLHEMDNIRPLLFIPLWIDGLLERTCPHQPTRRAVKRVWDRLADEFLDHPFVRRRDTWCPVDMVDGLARALKFSRGLSVGSAARVAQWVFKLRGASTASYAGNALAEQDFRNRRARHIVYGHTHHAETIPLDASNAEGYVLNQLYFNSGTWRRVYEQTQLSPGEHEFIAADTMTYLAFFAGDERRGRSFETWSGRLGLAPLAGRYRIDAQSTSLGKDHAAAEPISTSGVPLCGPHFTLSPASASSATTQYVV
jgi:UDP-2,3-diacylglucosamine pyrophosphatase LpxH